MFETTVRHPSKLHLFGQDTANVEAMAVSFAGACSHRYPLTSDLESSLEPKRFLNNNGLTPGSCAARLLLIDDDPGLLPKLMRQVFPTSTHRVEAASTGMEGLEQIRNNPPDVIRLDRHLPDQCGLELFQAIRSINSRIPVIFMTLSKDSRAAIQAMQQGAYDYLLKPLEPQLLRRVVGEALEVARQLRQPVAAVENADATDTAGAIIGSCPAMLDVYKAIGRVADKTFPVLIAGESGTGKELVARAIYQHSSRSKAPFLGLNCAAIPENLLESELFGHEKGAFTGADRKRIGKFEQCHGGTLFLDEIGDMPLTLQAKILRLLQDQSFERVGGNETVRTDVRLIAATHRDLTVWSAEGKFRQDLYFRLGVFTIKLPPLRERGEDLPILVQHYLRRLNCELGREISVIPPEVMQCLRGYSWPGNVRELESVLKQALLRASGTVLFPAFLPDWLFDLNLPYLPPLKNAGLDSFIEQRIGPQTKDLYSQAQRELDRILLSRVLEYTCGSQHQAARVLGIARKTLRAKLAQLGLQITRRVAVGVGD